MCKLQGSAKLPAPGAGEPAPPISQAEIRHVGVHRLALFGSVVRDDARPDSEVDVLVILTPPRRLSPWSNRLAKRFTISDDRPVYSDEEFALILRKAAELAETPDPRSHSPGGLTLAEMKAAAAQAGFDPALVERAARLLRANATAAPSFMERLIGGRTRHGNEAHFPIVLDEAGAAKLLSAVRIGVGRSGEGHSGPTGLTWRSSDDGGAVLSLTALTDHEGTSVTADLDRRGTLVVVGSLTLVSSFLALAFGGTVAGEIVPGLEAVGGLSGVGAVLALARSYWASSTRTARERLSRVMDSVDRILTSGDPTFIGAVGKRMETAANEGEAAGEAS